MLARKGGIDASKPIKRPRFIENLCRFSLYSAQDPSLTLEDDARVNNPHNPSDCFAPLFQKREPKRLERFIGKLTFNTKTR